MSTLDDIKGLPERMDRIERLVDHAIEHPLIMTPSRFVIIETKTGYLVRMDVQTGETWATTQANLTATTWIRINEPLP